MSSEVHAVDQVMDVVDRDRANDEMRQCSDNIHMKIITAFDWHVIGDAANDLLCIDSGQQQARMKNELDISCQYRTVQVRDGVVFYFYLRCSYVPEFGLDFSLPSWRLQPVLSQPLPDPDSDEKPTYRLQFVAHGCWGGSGIRCLDFNMADVVLKPGSGHIRIQSDAGLAPFDLKIPSQVAEVVAAVSVHCSNHKGCGCTRPDLTTHAWSFKLPTNLPSNIIVPIAPTPLPTRQTEIQARWDEQMRESSKKAVEAYSLCLRYMSTGGVGAFLPPEFTAQTS